MPPPRRVARQQGAVQMGHRRAEGRAERHEGVEEAFRVGAAHGHAVLRGNGADLALPRPPILARLFREARADDDGRANALLAACFQRLSHEGGRDGDDGEVGRCRQVGDAWVAREPVDLRMSAADWENRPRETVLPDRRQHPPPDDARIGGGPDEGDRPGREQRVEVGHPRAAYRSPRPRAMMPRRISRVPPWMVSLGAIMVAWWSAAS